MKKLLMMVTLVCAMSAAAEPWKPAARWRGFNLLEMFNGRYEPFKEDDFKWIHEWGFNFVRLPMDYRGWIKDGDWEKFDESRLAWIDDAIRLGQKYNVHVQVCFHRAPGYTVAQPPEKRDLFTDPEALRVCALHWGAFAKRYKDVPPKDLSFNLFNEPANVPEEAYLKVATELVNVIRAENPDRMIMADGSSWGSKPTAALIPLGVAQASRGYTPMSVSHYKASWINPPPSEPPCWPPTPAVSPLYSSGKAPWNVPLVIEGDNMPDTLVIRPGRVSGTCTLRVETDGRNLITFTLDPKEGDGWTNVDFKKEWNVTQADCTSAHIIFFPNPFRRLQISVSEGDWVGLRDLTLIEGGRAALLNRMPNEGDRTDLRDAPLLFLKADQNELKVFENGKSATLTFSEYWGKTNQPLRFCGLDAKPAFQPAAGDLTGQSYLWQETIAPWQPVVDAGIFVMVGEFGSHSQTPHGVVLPWLEDSLKNWKKANWGWALWNFRGSFGIMDSNRADVQYEDFNGHKLDRKMLDLLRRY